MLELAIYHNQSFIKNVPSAPQRTNSKIWFLKISEPFIFEVGSTGCERCSRTDLFCGSGSYIFFRTSFSLFIHKKQWNIQDSMKKLKHFERERASKAHTLTSSPAGSLSDNREGKVVRNRASDPHVCPPASLQSRCPMWGDYMGCSLTGKGTGAGEASLRWLPGSCWNPLMELGQLVEKWENQPTSYLAVFSSQVWRDDLEW